MEKSWVGWNKMHTHILNVLRYRCKISQQVKVGIVVNKLTSGVSLIYGGRHIE